MVWVVPNKGFTGQTLWNELERSKYFVLQRHKASDTILMAPLHLLKSTWAPTTERHAMTKLMAVCINNKNGHRKNGQRYRIIINAEPYHVIASAASRDEIYDHWV
jgi:hypothetical protein